MEDKRKVLLSIRGLKVRFRVRGRLLTAIRGIDLDIYENESIAIVGESGSGKSVFTKTFAGMLDSNGFVSDGTIIFGDEELTDLTYPLDENVRAAIRKIADQLDQSAKLEAGAHIWKQILELESAERARGDVSEGESGQMAEKLSELKNTRASLYNQRLTMDPAKEKQQLKDSRKAIADLDREIKALEKQVKKAGKEAAKRAKADTAASSAYKQRHDELTALHSEATRGEISAAAKERDLILAREVYMSAGRYQGSRRTKLTEQLIAALTDAMRLGVDLDDEQQRNKVFDTAAFRVAYAGESQAAAGETEKSGNPSDRRVMKGKCVYNLANVRYADEWTQIRGRKIATVFQDPMTSLNPILTIGNQISSIIIKHQGVSENEARQRALVLMSKVGIPNPAARYDDYPFQYSGGMRQRIVIAIALSCQPKILICDEPTTALDVTIQAQILQLIKNLQKEFGYTIVFITHDLGVVANVADRVAVIYAGQIIELGTVEDIFYDPRHPYTWALLSSLPQLAQRNTTLYSITGTPPSLYNEIKGDAFAPRNPYCLKIDTVAEPPMFKVSETHYAKTWLLHPSAPKIEKPEAIQNIHEKLKLAFNID